MDGRTIRDLAHLLAQREPTDADLRDLLNLLLRMGFCRVRFYRVLDTIRPDEALLTVALPREMHPTDAVGRTFPRSVLGCLESNERWPLRMSYAQTVDAAREIADYLGQQAYAWVEVPVCSFERVMGIVALDWDPDEWRLSSAAESHLSILGRVIADELIRVEDSRLLRANEQLDDLLVSGDEPDKNRLIATLGGALGAGTAALFQFDWARGQLDRVAEWVNPVLKGQLAQLDESYEIDDSFTGGAWIHEELRIITDFYNLPESTRSRVYEPSRLRQESLLGRIETVMYGRIGVSDPKFLVRLINHQSAERLHFRDSDFRILGRLCDRVGRATDLRADDSRVTTLTELASTDIEDEVFLASLAAGLKDGGVQRAAILQAHRRSLRPLRAFHVGDGHVFALTLEAAESENLSALQLLLAGNSVLPRTESVKELLEAIGVGGDWTIDQGALLVLDISVGDTIGVAIVDSECSEKALRYSLEQSHLKLKSWIVAVMALVAQRSEAMYSRAVVSGASDALALISHEATGPLVSLASIATQSISTARSLCNTMAQLTGFDTDEDLSNLASLSAQVDSEAKRIELYLSVASILGYERAGAIEMNIGSHRLSAIVGTAVSQVEDEFMAEEISLSRSKLPFRSLIVSSAIPEDLEVSCDRILLEHCIRNLLRNAAKYSYPRRARSAVVVQIKAWESIRVPSDEPWVYLDVSNEGAGISDADQDSIFGKFVRGDLDDSVRAFRGMGLGLYLARAYAEAHNGALTCKESVSVSGRWRKGYPLEGFRTTFRLEMPQRLATGPRSFLLGGDR